METDRRESLSVALERLQLALHALRPSATATSLAVKVR
jgi:hypothetical protein